MATNHLLCIGLIRSSVCVIAKWENLLNAYSLHWIYVFCSSPAPKPSQFSHKENPHTKIGKNSRKSVKMVSGTRCPYVSVCGVRWLEGQRPRRGR